MCGEKFPFFGSRRGKNLQGSIRSLLGKGSEPNSTDREADWLYRILGVLDAKANSLLRVNSLFIGFIAIAIGIAGHTANDNIFSGLTDCGKIIAWASFFALICSSALCFLIIEISWKFLGNIKAVVSPASLDLECGRLAQAADDRTWYYFIAWGLAVLGFIGLSVTVLIYAKIPTSIQYLGGIGLVPIVILWIVSRFAKRTS